ncbi:Protein arginine methyltransferase NDUFAF7 [Blattella germanica]|nr:Protein arginine methyltransferase NDUFAF7 [Blattella germanica]
MLSMFRIHVVPLFLTLKCQKTMFRFINEGEHSCSNINESASLARYLKAKIKAVGPISVAEYMKEVLTNPLSGYYMHRDMIGEAGDFITSPELGQLFGEMIAIWCFNEWQKVGSPIPLQLVEMGPGRGSLAADVLRVFERFGAGGSELSLHLVEVSPYLSQLQAELLCVKSAKNTPSSKVPYYRVGTTASNIPVFWYDRITDVPRQFSCFLAHEFFDALPIHKFQGFHKHKLHDPLIEPGIADLTADVDFSFFRACTEDKLLTFGPVTQRDFLLRMGIDLRLEPYESRNHIEISPESAVILEQLATRLEEDGGFALIADYGHDGTNTDTFRGFHKHKLHDPLIEPGIADLTADVDFSFFRACTEDKLLTFGPVTQRDFLLRMGIDLRLEILLRNCDEKQRKNLISGYHMMVDKDKMGERFKFFSLFPSVLQEHLTRFPVNGFTAS